MASINQITDAILPSIDSTQLEIIQDKLGCKNSIEIDITPRPHAVENECHTNVLRQIKWYGGDKIEGYYVAISEKENKWVAIKHSVWRKDNELIDVTPVSDNRTKNIFVWGSKNLSSAVYFNGQEISHQQV
jgi:hypothetical protein